MQNLQRSGPIPDLGQATAFSATAIDQRDGDSQGAHVVAGEQVAPDFTANPLMAYLKGLGWQGMQVPNQSVVVNMVTTPAPQLPLMPNQATALSMPPLPIQVNVARVQPLTPQVSPQMPLPAPMQFYHPFSKGRNSDDANEGVMLSAIGGKRDTTFLKSTMVTVANRFSIVLFQKVVTQITGMRE